jgi:hypothetical protein
MSREIARSALTADKPRDSLRRREKPVRFLHS